MCFIKPIFQYYLIIFIIIQPIQVTFANTQTKNIPSEPYQVLKDTIIAFDVTREKAGKDLDLTSDKKSKKDYQVFIEYLTYRIDEYCSKIAFNYGVNKLQNLPCKSQENITSTKTIKTTTEEVQSLDDQFQTSLGNFDDLLLKEDEIINQKKSEQQKSSTNKSSTNKSSATKKEPNQNTSQTKPTQNKESSNTNGKQTTNHPVSQKERQRLDKIDDDIVARQLKEAAENEKDPKLKEKLWNEYYKYKKNRL